jgi:hypothetical protein
MLAQMARGVRRNSVADRHTSPLLVDVSPRYMRPSSALLKSGGVQNSLGPHPRKTSSTTQNSHRSNGIEGSDWSMTLAGTCRAWRMKTEYSGWATLRAAPDGDGVWCDVSSNPNDKPGRLLRSYERALGSRVGNDPLSLDRAGAAVAPGVCLRRIPQRGALADAGLAR